MSTETSRLRWIGAILIIIFAINMIELSFDLTNKEDLEENNLLLVTFGIFIELLIIDFQGLPFIFVILFTSIQWFLITALGYLSLKALLSFFPTYN